MITVMAMSGGSVIWLTGLPGSGKTTIAKLLHEKLRNMSFRAEILDGDEVRKNLSPDLGFSKQDRETHAKRVVYLAKLLSRNDVVSIVALISPYRAFRDSARETIGKNFVEVWVKASSETCQQRDPTGLYKKAAQGKVQALTGVSDPYEPPVRAELVINTESEGPEESVGKLLTFLRQNGYLFGPALNKSRLQLE
jgi:adenylylsulfate kinase